MPSTRTTRRDFQTNMILKFFYHVEKRLLTRKATLMKGARSTTDANIPHLRLAQENQSETVLEILQ